MKKNNINLGVIGLWHLGSVYSACLAKMGFNVTGFDFDKTVVENLKKGTPPIYEPQLTETIKNCFNKNLYFTDKAKEICNNKNYIFITFDLPVNEQDIVSLKLIDKVTELLSQNIVSPTTIVISSQVPLGTTRKLFEQVKKQSKQDINVIYFPENLRLGKAFESFLTPDRIILGADKESTAIKFINDFSGFDCPFLTMSLESAEMVKHALNTYLATCVSYSSEIADLSEKLGANMKDVVSALKTDRRVSQYAPVNPGMGFAGGTLGRDIQTLKKLGKKYNYETKLMNTIYAINQDRLPMLVEKIKMLVPSLSNSNIGILGLTYKPGTNTLRRSLSLGLSQLLNSKGARIKAFDPMIHSKITTHPYIKVCTKIEELFKDLDMVILMTEWPEFLKLPIKKLTKLMKRKNIIDTKNFLDSNQYIKEDFIYKGIGM